MNLCEATVIKSDGEGFPMKSLAMLQAGTSFNIVQLRLLINLGIDS